MSDKIKRLLADGVITDPYVGGHKQRRLLSPEEAVTYLGNVITVQTLANRRMRGQRPAWVKIGSRVAYEIEELDSWVVACRVVLPEVPPMADEPKVLTALPPADAPKRGPGRPPRKAAVAV